jgi:WD40 repeat protein
MKRRPAANETSARLRTILALSAVTLAAAASLSVTPATGAVESGRIAFTSYRDGNAGIYVMNADGSDPARLTNNGDVNPSFSPDGTKIVFDSYRHGDSEIYVMNADGSGLTRLTNNYPTPDNNPSFSPDGTKIVFDSYRNDSSDIYVMNADGSDQTRLTGEPAWAEDRAPSFSPDGTKIAFMSSRDGVGGTEIYVMNADGSVLTRLTNNQVLDTVPSFSPDGTKIVFTSYRDNNEEIYVMNADGSGQTRLTSSGSSDRNPSFSRDGTKIAFMSYRDGNAEIYVMNADGSDQTRLTNNSSIDDEPSFGGSSDADGDALLDTWETSGLDTDGDGEIDVDLPAMGADPRHKDIFLEIDSMEPHRLGQAAINRVVAAFAAAPVANPDGTTGISLHVDNGPDSIMVPASGATWGDLSEADDDLPHQPVLGSYTTGGEYDWSAFDSIKKTNFSVTRLPVFHYVVSGHRYGAASNDSGGISRGIEASDLIVALGMVSEPSEGSGTLEWQAGTLMHELGHNLGLWHGGFENVNYKPNYLSIMNYAFPVGLRRTASSGAVENNVFDYSRFDFDLDEDFMSEAFGFGFLSAAPQAAYFTLFRCAEKRFRAPLAAASIDFNCDAVIETQTTVGADLNADGKFRELPGYNDWDNLIFDGGAVGDAAGAVVLPQTSEANEPQLDELLENARVLKEEDGGTDTTAPTLVVPSDITKDATGPGGAVVSYSVSASDDVDSSPSVSCAPPSGSLFAIGVTTVACTAEDAAGNEANASFQIRVRGAAEQLVDLIALVESYGLGKLGTSLRDKLVTVQRFLAAGKPRQAEENLATFISQVEAQRGKGLTAGQADALLTAARRISDVIET